MVPRVFLFAWMVALMSCQHKADDAKPTVCTKSGQTCNLAPGVLGVCTQAPPDKCDREPCFVCMSQH